MKKLILLLSLLPFLTFAEIYKSVDAEGNTIYTDIPPNADAKELQVDELNVSEPPKPRREQSKDSNNSKAPKKQVSADRYARLAITSPKNEDTLRDNEGKVGISVELTPVLQTKYSDTLYIAMDGVIINDGKASVVDLEGVDRGTHTITAYVQDDNGNVIVSAEAVVFHLFRTVNRN